MDAKYFLSPKQYGRLRPPLLSDSKWNNVQAKEAPAYRGMLDIHKNHRKTVAVGLESCEVTAKANGAVQEYLAVDQATHDGTPEEGLIPGFTLPSHQDFYNDQSKHAVEVRKRIPENMKDNGARIDGYADELAALRMRNGSLERLLANVLDARQADCRIAQAAAERH